ncbi:hypothetical protein ACA910_011518 [Epithemia clementina (nom. ined.)]
MVTVMEVQQTNNISRFRGNSASSVSRKIVVSRALYGLSIVLSFLIDQKVVRVTAFPSLVTTPCVIPASFFSSHHRQCRRSSIVVSSALVVSTLVEETNDVDATARAQQQDDQYDEDGAILVDDTNARSMFGTKLYWDEVYLGRGDVPADCYSWYYSWDVMRKIVEPYMVAQKETARILIPGIGNDSLLLDLYKAGYGRRRRHGKGGGGCLVGQDYSHHAVERQHELLAFEQIIVDSHHDNSKNKQNMDNNGIQLVQGDVTRLPTEWKHQFDFVLEKGLLDAVYLSSSDNDTGNVEAAVNNLHRVLRPGGLLISVSGVVTNDLRRNVLFPTSATPKDVDTNDNNDRQCGFWKWLRDGSDDWTKAGCYVFQKED